MPADAVKIWLFILTSVLAGLAGMISAFRISAASPVAGTGYELEVIAMVVVGGTALTGGRGTIFGTMVGALMLRAIRNGIVLVGVPGLAFNIFVGAIILVMLDPARPHPEAGQEAMTMAAEVLRLERISKSFGSVHALKSASMTLREGEVGGAARRQRRRQVDADQGHLRRPSRSTAARSSCAAEGRRSARRATPWTLGIETIHQDTSLAPDLSIARNLFLGREPVRLPWLGVFAPLDLAELRRCRLARC